MHSLSLWTYNKQKKKGGGVGNVTYEPLFKAFNLAS